jgi:hypothetical protein
LQIKIGVKLQNPLENQIGPRERVGVADRSQAYSFGRPGTDALRLKHRLSKQQRILSFRKGDSPAQDPAAKLSNRFSARKRGLNFEQIAFRQNVRAGE